MKEEYNGYTIEWTDYGRTFTIKKDGELLRSKVETVDESKKWIDKKSKQKFNRVPIYLLDWNKIVEGEVTSKIGETCAWVSTLSGRSKRDFKNIVLRNEESEKIVSKIRDNNKKKSEIEAENNKLEESLPRLTPEMMVEI